MNIKVSRKRPWHLGLIALFLLFMYSMGIYDLFMMLITFGLYFYCKYIDHHYQIEK